MVTQVEPKLRIYARSPFYTLFFVLCVLRDVDQVELMRKLYFYISISFRIVAYDWKRRMKIAYGCHKKFPGGANWLARNLQTNFTIVDNCIHRTRHTYTYR